MPKKFTTTQTKTRPTTGKVHLSHNPNTYILQNVFFLLLAVATKTLDFSSSERLGP